jgi:hypothetical protein
MMHFATPTGEWRREDLDALERRTATGNRLCEAGCYQCLLSYYNQPDHPSINRRDEEALRILVALANAQVVSVAAAPPGDPSAAGEPADNRLEAWLAELSRRGGQQPDAVSVPVQQGAATAAAQYRGSRALVFLEPIGSDIRDSLIDKGWQLLDFSDPAQWPGLFATHAAIFGTPGGQA